MRRLLGVAMIGLFVGACDASDREARITQLFTMKIPAPEFAGVDEWINSRPLKIKELRGKVIVLHFWCFG